MWFYKKILCTAGTVFFSVFILIFYVLNSLDIPSVSPENCINLRVTSSPGSLDPVLGVDLISGEIMAKLYSGLVKLDFNMNIVPDLADTFEVQDHGRKFFFRLKENIKFSDGTDIIAHDILRSWKRVVSPANASPRAWVFDAILGMEDYVSGKSKEIKGISILNTKEMSIELKEAYTPFLNLLTMPAAYIVPDESLMGHVFSGPYVMKEYKADNFMLLESNMYYEGISKKFIFYHVLPEDLSAVALFKQGKLDVFKVPKNQIPFYSQPDKKDWQELEELNTYYLGFDHRKKDLDVSFRQAVFAMLDRDVMLEIILQGMGNVCESVVPGSLLKNIEADKNTFDLKRWKTSQESVQTYLEKSTFGRRELTILLSASAESRLLGIYLQDALLQYHIQSQIKMMDWSAYKDAIHNGQGDIFYLSWWADYADAENFLYPVFHSKNHGAGGNRTYYTSHALDAMLEQLHRETGKERENVLTGILIHLNMEMPWIPLWHKTSYFAVNPRLKSFQVAPVYTMEKAQEWVINETVSE